MPNGYWEDKEHCRVKCSECKGLKELRKKSYACYLSVKKHGWDTEFFEVKQKPIGYWNDKEHCMEEAKKYRTVRELQLASDGCYASLKRNGWLLEAYPPKNGLKPINYWNVKENVMKAAKQCNTKMEFRTKFGGAFMSAVRNGWMPEIENEFVSGQTSRKIWTYERCKEFCKDYKYKAEVEKANYQCYMECLKNGWFEEFGIVNKTLPNGYWKSHDNCISAAKECKTKSEFTKKYMGAYKSAKENGWMEEINEIIHSNNPEYKDKSKEIEDVPKVIDKSTIENDTGNNKNKVDVEPTREKKDFVVRKLSDEERKKIIEEYKTVSIANICKEWYISDRRVKQILLDNGVTIRKTNQATVASNDYNEQNAARYPHVDGKKYVAVLRSDESVVFDDYLNKSGTLIAYIKKNLLITPPSLFKRKKYFFDHGKQWYEMFFDIRLVNDNSITKKCPYCGWETTDVDNKSGAYMNHITIEHNMTPEEHLKLHPEDKIFFKRVVREKEKQKLYSDPHNYVVCPICGKKFMKLTKTHIEDIHGMSFFEFRRKYPNVRLVSDIQHKQIMDAQIASNLVVPKKLQTSSAEREISRYIEGLGFSVENGNRSILGGREIDILVESKKLCIEYNGLKYHCETIEDSAQVKDSNYHISKTLIANEKGYKLIQIYDDEYNKYKDLVLNKIKRLLGVKDDLIKAYGRKCCIHEITLNQAKEFLNVYHIQGFVSASVYLGAFYNDILIGVMSFKINKQYQWELNRFATNFHYLCTGVGGKLLSYFVKSYSPNMIVSFADIRWTVDKDNNLYTKLGFKLDSVTKPDYYYCDKNYRSRLNKRMFRKDKLIREYPNEVDRSMTESQMTKKLGFRRIWNCGLFKYIWLNPE